MPLLSIAFFLSDLRHAAANLGEIAYPFVQMLKPSWWFAFAGEALPWHAATVALGWLAFPLLFSMLRRLPDGGYAVARIGGAFLFTYLNWLLCNWGMRFSAVSMGVALGLVAAASVGTAWFRRREFAGRVRAMWRYILVVEALAFFLFLLLLNIRSYASDVQFNPGYHGSEKLGNMMHLSTMWRADTFPAEDSWLAQEADEPGRARIARHENYYYGGHLQWATITRLTNTPPTTAYNLALATLFSWFGMGAFGLVWNATRRYAFATVAAYAAIFFGNLEPFDQLPHMLQQYDFYRAQMGGAAPGADDAVKAKAMEAYPFDWNEFSLVSRYELWRASRVILHLPDKNNVLQDNTVNEFPYFSFILGDLHAHSNSLPLWLLMLHLLFAIYAAKNAVGGGWHDAVWAAPRAAIGVCLLGGGLAWFNGWEPAPLGLFLVGFLILDREDWRRRKWLTPALAGSFGLFAIIAGLYVFLLPHTLAMQAPLDLTKPGFLKPRTWLLASRADEIFIFWALIWGPLAFLLASELNRNAKGNRGAAIFDYLGILGGLCMALVGLFKLPQDSIQAVGSPSGIVRWILSYATAAFCVALGAAMAALACWLRRRDARNTRERNLPAIQSQSAFFTIGLAFFGLALLGMYSGSLAAGMCAAIGLGCAAAAWRGARSEDEGFLWRIAFGACGVILFAELFYIDDGMGTNFERYNTIFKLYYPAWVILLCATIGLLAYRDTRHAQNRNWPQRLPLWLGGAFVLFLGSAYPFLATWSRTDGFYSIPIKIDAGYQGARFNDAMRTRTLDGTYFLTGMASVRGGDIIDRSAEREAIRLLQDREKIPGRPHILEASDDMKETRDPVTGVLTREDHTSYAETGRVAAYTGLPSILGWTNHERQWRGWNSPGLNEEIERRREDIKFLYEYKRGDPGGYERFNNLLARYNIRFVFVGGLERASYPAADFDKFGAIGGEFFRSGDVVVYDLSAAPGDAASGATR